MDIIYKGYQRGDLSGLLFLHDGPVAADVL